MITIICPKVREQGRSSLGGARQSLGHFYMKKLFNLNINLSE